MKCPNCQNERPAESGDSHCQFCGAAWSPQKDGGDLTTAPVKLNAKVFFLLFLGPPVLTLVTAWLLRPPGQDLSFFIGLLGGGAGGFVCGVMLGLRAARSVPQRILLCLLLAPIFAVGCITLCFFGCTLGGYQLQFH